MAAKLMRTMLNPQFPMFKKDLLILNIY